MPGVGLGVWNWRRGNNHAASLSHSFYEVVRAWYSLFCCELQGGGPHTDYQFFAGICRVESESAARSETGGSASESDQADAESVAEDPGQAPGTTAAAATVAAGGEDGPGRVSSPDAAREASLGGKAAVAAAAARCARRNPSR